MQKKNYNRWNERFEQQTVELPYLNPQSIDKVIVSLMDGDDAVSYYVDSVKNYIIDHKADTPPDHYKWV